MCAAESISVPSQSNTRTSYRPDITCLSPLDHSLQGSKESLQFRGKRCLYAYRLRTSGMAELQACCVQEHALESLLSQTFVSFQIPVLVIARNRKADMRQMHPDLMRTPGLQFGIQQAIHRKLPNQAE